MATREEERRINVGMGPAAPVAIAGLNNLPRRTRATATTEAQPGVPQVNVGFGQSRPVEPSARGPSLAQRAFRGDFQARRRTPTGTQPQVNVGIGPVQRTLEPGSTSPVSGGAGSTAAPVLVAARMPGVQSGSSTVPVAVAPPPAVPPAPNGAPALARGDTNTFTFSDGRTVAAPAASASNARGAVVRTLDPSMSMPSRVASTYGQSVLSMPDDSVQVARQPVGTLSGPGTMAEQYNSREDREAIRRLSGKIDSDVFRLSFAAGRRGREGRQAQSAISALRGEQANLLGGESNRTEGQVARRSLNDANAAATQMQQQGEMHRAALRDATDRARITADTDYRSNSLAAEQSRPSQLVRGLDGNTTILRNDGSVGTLRDEAGNPIQTPEQTAGALTPAALLDSYTQQSRAINEGPGTPEEKAQQQAALRADPMFGTLFAQQQGGARAVPPAAAIERLRANPAAAAQFDEIFGPGAAAQYLNR